MRTTEAWESLRSFDAVVATPKTVSPEENLVFPPPNDLFDLVFIDEAHHAAAKIWKSIVLEFATAQAVLLTATAFRRDRRRLPGRLVYHYPIGRALDDGIYRPIDFVPVGLNHPDTLDRDIAKAAIEKLQSEHELNPDAALLIRTDRIEKCERLRQLYSDLGVSTVEIHSQVTSTLASQRLNQLRSGDVKAVVTVGMMAEGLDVPNLKIVALHAPPCTLPYTLQLLGRISRTPQQQTGSAWFITSPEQVRGEARRLFREDRDWKRFIPQLVEDAVRDAHGNRADIILGDTSTSSLLPELLKPYFSVEVLRFSKPDGSTHIEKLPSEPEVIKGLPKDVESIEVLSEVDEGCVAIITTSTRAPRWGLDTGLADTRHDLHILYAPPDTHLLFVATTSRVIMQALMSVLVDETVEVDPKNLQGVLSEAVANEYISVGLENALGLTGTHPSYRMHLGSGAGSSVRPSDGSVYGVGHAMGKMLDDERRGVATGNRRIWAMRRQPIEEFTAWCRGLAAQILAPGEGLPGLTFLAQPVLASEVFTEQPIGIAAADRHFGLPASALSQIGDVIGYGDQDPVFSDVKMNDSVMTATLAFQSDPASAIKLSYRADLGSRHWTVEDKRQFEIEDPDSGERESLEDFLNEYPPIILMPSGGAVRGGYAWKIIRDGIALPNDMFRNIDWTETDITKESKQPNDARNNVQETTLEVLKECLSNSTVIINDDGAYEIADFIAVDPDKKLVVFVHCKYSENANPGNRVKDWYELFGQCTRSHTWVRYGKLFQELARRIGDRRSTEFVSSAETYQHFETLVPCFKVNEWTFQVWAVQPGCDVDRVLSDKGSHVYRGLASVREWLLQAGAEFIVLGSRSSSNST